MPGCGPLTAAKLLGESAGISRFKSEAAFARHAGIAPIPVWSGPTARRVRMTRSGNRQLNAAIRRIAITQTRLDGLGKIYYEKKKAEGMTTPKPCGVSNDGSRASSFHLTTDHQARQQPVPASLPAAA
jgi:transposase